MNNLIFKGIINKDSINKENGDRIFQSFGSIAIKDRQGDFIPIDEFKPIMQKLMATEDGIPVNDSHTNHRVGKIIAYDFRKNDRGEDGLFLTCKIFRNQPSDDLVWEAVKDGRFSGMSLGGKAGSKIPTCDQEGCFNVLKDIEIFEFSLVETPANPGALITEVNKLAKGYEITKYVRQCGDEWCVYSESGKRLGTHGSKEDAYKQLYAIEINKVDAGDDWIDRNWKPNVTPDPSWSDFIKEKWKRMDEEHARYKHLYENTSKKYRVYIKHPSEAPKNAHIVRGPHGGFYYQVKKAKVYIKNPSQVPIGVELQEGPRGGKYYESDIQNKPQQTQMQTQTKKPGLAALVFKEFAKRQPGQGLERIIDNEEHLNIILENTIFGLVSAGRNPNNEMDKKLTDEQIKQRHLQLKKELIKRGYVFTPVVGKYGEIEDSFLVMVHDTNESELIEIGKMFNQDSVIIVDHKKNSMIYTSGQNYGKRIRGNGYNKLPSEQSNYYTQVFIKNHGFVKFALNFDFDHLLEKILKSLR